MSSGYRTLDVWNKAYKLTLDIYKTSKSFPKDETYGITSQMRRASLSIIANLAEGYNKNRLREYIRYVSISIGSSNELEVYLSLSFDLNYLNEKEFNNLISEHKIIGKMLFGLRNSLEKKHKEDKANFSRK